MLEMKYESEKEVIRNNTIKAKEEINKNITSLTTERRSLDEEISKIKENIKESKQLLQFKKEYINKVAESLVLEERKLNELNKKEEADTLDSVQELKKTNCSIIKLEKTKTKLEDDIKERDDFFSKLVELKGKLNDEINIEKQIVDKKKEISSNIAELDGKIERTKIAIESVDDTIIRLNKEKLDLSQKYNELQNSNDHINKSKEDKGSLVLIDFEDNSPNKFKNDIEKQFKELRDKNDTITEEINTIQTSKAKQEIELKEIKQKANMLKYKLIETNIEELSHLIELAEYVHENDKRYILIMSNQINIYKSELKHFKEE